MYDIDFDPEFDEFLQELSITDSSTHDIIIKKIKDIAIALQWSNKHHKNLEYPLNKFRRVHIKTHFVLVFRVNMVDKEVTFLAYDHHDKYMKIKDYCPFNLIRLVSKCY